MKKSKFTEPYKKVNKQDKTNFRNTWKKSGAYIIKDKNTNKILYVGSSRTNLYKTMYRHFQSWEDKQKRAVYGKYKTKVRVILTSPQRARNLEIGLVKKYSPRDIDNKYRQLEINYNIKKAERDYKEADIIPF